MKGTIIIMGKLTDMIMNGDSEGVSNWFANADITNNEDNENEDE